jgi:DNA-binding CsgD family transcriptional regulator
VLDGAGAAVLLNRRAETLLAGDGLLLEHGRLRAAIKTEDQRLQQAISRVLTAATGSSPPSPASVDLLVRRDSGKRSYQILVAALPTNPEREARWPAATVMIFDPERELAAPYARMHELFGFTRAEAAVALAVMQGKSLEQAASIQNNSVATTRNLLKRVFLKAGVCRQNELTRVLLDSPLSIDIEGAPKEN